MAEWWISQPIRRRDDIRFSAAAIARQRDNGIIQLLLKYLLAVLYRSTCIPVVSYSFQEFPQTTGLQVEETVFHGIEQWPQAFAALFRGQNIGKVVIRM